jgi:hypothetical protein
MRLSAQMIGQRVGMSAQEVNVLLHLSGLIDGEPGAWGFTEEGARYAIETVHERGTGGYAFMNPSWPVTTWHESVMTVLDLSETAKQQARQIVADRRVAQAAARKSATAAAELARVVDVPRAAQRMQTARSGAGASNAALALLGLAAAYGFCNVRRRLRPVAAGVADELPTTHLEDDGRQTALASDGDSGDSDAS